MKKLAVIVLVVLFGEVSAQFAEQQALFHNLPQSRYLNPGVAPDFNGYFTFPGLSGIGLSASNSGFAYKDFYNDAGKPDLNNLLEVIADRNYLNLGARMDVIGFGFKAKKNFFSFNVSPRVDVNFGYNKEFFDFFINGNANYIAKEMSLDGFAFDVSSFVEFGFGVNREISEKLNGGVRPKLLMGIGNIIGDFDGVSLYTDPDDYAITASSTFEIRNYGSFLFDESVRNDMGDPSIFNPSNLGFGLDAGASYKFSEKINFYGSITDLGFVSWKEYGERLYNDGAEFSFDGMSYDEFTGNEDSEEEGGYFEQLADSAESVFELKRERVNYTTALKSSFRLGGDYKVNDFLDAQGMVFGRFFNRKLYPGILAAASLHAGKWITFKGSYMVCNQTYANVGGGFVLHLGPFQLYAMMDNLLGLTQLDYARAVNGSFGINFTFKDNDKRKEKRKQEKQDKKGEKDNTPKEKEGSSADDK